MSKTSKISFFPLKLSSFRDAACNDVSGCDVAMFAAAKSVPMIPVGNVGASKVITLVGGPANVTSVTVSTGNAANVVLVLPDGSTESMVNILSLELISVLMQNMYGEEKSFDKLAYP